MSTSESAAPAPREPRRKYVPAVGSRLRALLYFVFAVVALLAANSIYLASITALSWANETSYENFFYLCMFGLHLVLGLILILPFIAFGSLHLLNTRHRKNRRAVRIGYALFTTSLLLLFSGVLLVRVEGFLELKQQFARSTVYWVHVACPLVAIWLYWLHRLAGPRIKWRVGAAYLGVVGAVVLVMVVLQAQDPRKWNLEGPATWQEYGHPSLAKTSTGKYIPARALMMDDYCKKCHSDIYDGWFHSVHHFSSFNNPAYLPSIRETRKVLLERDGNVQASRWCAGCHDPVPFFSGAFDQPNYDDVNDPTSQAGITCTVCHGITHVNSNRGNGDYTIEEPMHYPFAYSESGIGQFVNNQLLKAKPEFHKKTFLKPFHKTTEFCSTCHKVHLPAELNHYKEFLRGQNHFDPFLLSGVSGHGARSFYYPPKAQQNCNGCHMPLQASNDFGAKLFGSDQLSIHNHTFVGANTAVAWWNGFDDTIKEHQDFLKETMRVDIFGVKEGGVIDGELHAPLRPTVPTLSPGKTYLLETVIRTMKLGHLFTQGTVDSNEVWLEVKVTSGDRVIGRNGAMDDSREVDRWSHFVNVFLLDKNGNRISRRNPQDIFTPLYNHQIPPGAGQTVHFEMRLPADLQHPVTVELTLKYRKFDKEYTDFVINDRKPGDRDIRGHTPGEPYVNQLPITVLATDRVTFPVAGVDTPVENEASAIPEWQRWNDYGIGLLLKKDAELRQAAAAFEEVTKLGRYDGPLNLARVLNLEGRNNEAVEAIQQAATFDDPPAPRWTMAWLSGIANRQQGRLDEAEKNFRSVLEDRTAEMIERGFDFSLDYEVINLLGGTLFDQATQALIRDEVDVATELLEKAAATFHKTLAIDSENFEAHYNLEQIYTQLKDDERSAHHHRLHQRYKPDDNASEIEKLGRAKYPAANRAASEPVIYLLNRKGAPGLDADAQLVDPLEQESGGES